MMQAHATDKKSICEVCKKQNVTIYLIFGGEFFGFGGWSKYVRELTHYLIRKGFNVKVLYRFGRILIVNSGTNIIEMKKSICDSNKAYTLYMLLHHLPNPLTVIFSMIRLLIDVKSESCTQKILHAHDLSCSLLVAFCMHKLFRIPFIVQVHGFPLKEQRIKIEKSDSIFKKYIWFLTWYWHFIAAKLMLRCSFLVIVNNDEVKSFFESLGIPPDKLKVIHSAIDLKIHEEFLLSQNDAKQYLGLAENHEFTLGYIGGLRPEKNVNILIKSFAAFLKIQKATRAKLIIIGDGPDRVLLKKATTHYGIKDHVHFLGHVPDAYRLMSAFDVFVLPSLSEGSPIVLLEAMLARRAIIASDIPAIREIVENGKEALLFNPHDDEQLKDLIIKLYSNPKLKRELGENARKKVEQYDASVIFEKISQLYCDILKNP
ncbi:MAG: glycosyltransferase family 4 protein [Thermoproteota archaeon]